MASILANTFIASLGRALNIVLGIIVLSLISRFLGVTGYGSYALLLAYGAILQMAADLGLYLTLSRAMAAHPDKENDYLSHITSLRLTLLSIIFLLGWLITLATPSLRSLTAIYPIVALGFMAQSLSQLMMGVYQKYGTIWRATIGDQAGRLVQITGIIIVGAGGATLASMVTLFSLGLAVATFLHRRLLPATLHIRLTFSWTTWRQLLATSWPLGLVLILNVIYFRIDTIILSLYKPASQVGLYGLAYRLVESALFLPAMFGGLLLPHLSSAWQQKRLADFQHYLKQGFAATAWSAVFVVLTLVLFARPIVVLIAGPDFIGASVLLQILSFALGAMFLGNLAGFSLVAVGHHRTLLTIAASLAASNTILNFIFIPHYGAPAAAWTTLLTETLAALIASLAVWRLARFTVSAKYLNQLTFVALLTALVYFILPPSWPVLAIITIGAATYVATSILTRLITKKNIDLLIKVPSGPILTK